MKSRKCLKRAQCALLRPTTSYCTPCMTVRVHALDSGRSYHVLENIYQVGIPFPNNRFTQIFSPWSTKTNSFVAHNRDDRLSIDATGPVTPIIAPPIVTLFGDSRPYREIVLILHLNFCWPFDLLPYCVLLPFFTPPPIFSVLHIECTSTSPSASLFFCKTSYSRPLYL